MSQKQARDIYSLDDKQRIVLEVKKTYKSDEKMTLTEACRKSGIYLSLFSSFKKAIEEKKNYSTKKRMYSGSEQREKILEIKLAIANGCSKEEACKLANVGRNTYFNWLKIHPSTDLVDPNGQDRTNTLAGVTTQEEVTEAAHALAHFENLHGLHLSPPQIHSVAVTNNFQEFINWYNAPSYKVHLPNCRCERMHEVLSSLKLEPLDGLVVLPNINGPISLIYLSPNTGENKFWIDPMAMEQVLANEMFANATTIKASCAQCMLQNFPNGFVCVASTDRADVNWAIDWARLVYKKKVKAANHNAQHTSLHPDHFHYLCSLSSRSIAKLFDAQSKPREILKEATEDIIQQFKQQHIPAGEGQTILLQYHLKGLIKIFLASLSESDQSKYSFWLVGVYDIGTEKRRAWSINIPGGKRHIGETTWDCAKREMYEETSLPICSRWEKDERRGGDEDTVNMYYFVRHY